MFNKSRWMVCYTITIVSVSALGAENVKRQFPNGPSTFTCPSGLKLNVKEDEGPKWGEKKSMVWDINCLDSRGKSQGPIISVFKSVNGENVARQWKDGAIASERRVKDGMVEGENLWFYPNGALRRISNWSANIANGPQKMFREDGTLEFTQTVIDGKREGERIDWSPNGKKSSKTTYKNGKMDGSFEAMNNDGQVVRRMVFKDDAEVPELEDFSISMAKNLVEFNWATMIPNKNCAKERCDQETEHNVALYVGDTSAEFILEMKGTCVALLRKTNSQLQNRATVDAVKTLGVLNQCTDRMDYFIDGREKQCFGVLSQPYRYICQNFFSRKGYTIDLHAKIAQIESTLK